MAEVGKLIIVPESETQRIEIVFEADKRHGSYGFHRNSACLRFIALDRRHRVCPRAETDIPDYEGFGGSQSEPLRELRLVDIKAVSLLHRRCAHVHDLAR